MERLQGTIQFTDSGLVVPVGGVRHYPRVELTKQQKDWIRERDTENGEPSCQFPLAHLCHGIMNLHHVIPMSWGLNFEGMTPQEVNGPSNIITLCEAIHIGDPNHVADPNIVHPDMRHAKQDYRVGDKDSFSKMARHHRELMGFGLKYWFSLNDQRLQEVIHDRMYKMRHMRPYPGKRGD